MNIINFLKEQKASASLIYYGKDDMATGYQIKVLVDYEQEINEYYNKKSFDINNIDDYIDFLFVDMYSKLSEIIPLVRDDIKEKVQIEVNHLNDIRKKYKDSDCNKYIKHNFDTVLNIESLKKYDLRAYEIVDITLNYIKDNFKIFKENKNIYEYIVKNYAYKIFYHFNEYRNIFDKYPEFYNILFSEEILKGQMYTKISHLEDALKVIKSKDIELYNNTINLILKIIKERSFNTNLEKVMYTFNDIKSTRKLFEKIGEKAYVEIYNEEKKQEIILDEYIHKNGHKSSFEINIKDFVSVYENKEINWEIKSLMITHGRYNKKMVSRFESVLSKKREKNLIDLVSTNIPTNAYFTYSIQNELSIMMMFGKLMIRYMLFEDDRFDDLMNYLFAGIANYTEKFNINISNIEDDFNMISFTLKNLVNESKRKEKDELIVQLWNYNAIHLIVGVFEKIIRELYYENIQMKKYVPKEKLTLENIFKDEELDDMFGQANKKAFQYFLTSDNFVGNNLRNDICHYNNNIYEICTLDNTLTVVYILLTLTNELLLKVIKNDSK